MNFHCDCILCRSERQELWRVLWTFLAIAGFVLAIFSFSGCAHLPLTDPKGTGVAVVGEDATGFFFNDEGHALWLSEGVPASYFTPVADPIQTVHGAGNWHITDLMWHQGEAIRIHRSNPFATSFR